MAETPENPPAQEMEVEAPKPEDLTVENGAGSKRPREEAADNEPEKEETDDAAAKKLKADDSVDAEKGDAEMKNGDANDSGPVCLGPKSFSSSMEMFDYFFKLHHTWTPNVNINKYEHLVLLELLKKGHLEPEKKIGGGIRSFQIRYHPQFKSRCFFIIREDDTVDDFSFRKCVDHILPLPANMQPNDNKKPFHGGGGGRGGGGGGRGRGGRGRGRGGGGKPRY